MSEGPSILAKILARKREEVAAAKLRTAPAELARLAARARPRGFRSALESSPHRPSLIAEVKAASPSQGVIRADLDPAGLARAYDSAGAECLSVLTDRDHFGGSPEDLRRARAVTERPILRKDFVFDPYQLDEALAWGADAALLIVAMLPREEIEELSAAARERGLDVLTEVHDESELAFAEDLGAEMIGINNRDLRTFATDRGTTARLIAVAKSKALFVSESALSMPEHVAEVAAAGARAVLIGTAFCAHPDPAAAVCRIMGRLS